MIPEWLTWQAVRLFFGGIWTKAAPFVARWWREVLIAVLVLMIWHKDAQLAACHAFKADVKVAGKQATAAQQAVNHAPAAASQAIAEKSDAQAPAYYADVRAAAERMRRESPRCPSPAGVPGADHPATVNDGPAPASDVVSRPKADDDLLVAAAGRAAQMHADAEALIAAGVAKAN